MRRKIGILLCLLAGLSAPMEILAQRTDRFAVLPQSEGKHLALCSRPGPKVAGTWDPSVQDVLDLESRLGAISSLKAQTGVGGAQIAHPETFLRQYLGIVVNGTRLIYINAFVTAGADWRKKFVTICDGGLGVWGVLYNPQTHTFSNLETNGLA